jgi:hypothetical protein
MTSRDEQVYVDAIVEMIEVHIRNEWWFKMTVSRKNFELIAKYIIPNAKLKIEEKWFTVTFEYSVTPAITVYNPINTNNS